MPITQTEKALGAIERNLCIMSSKKEMVLCLPSSSTKGTLPTTGSLPVKPKTNDGGRKKRKASLKKENPADPDVANKKPKTLAAPSEANEVTPKPSKNPRSIASSSRNLFQLHRIALCGCALWSGGLDIVAEVGKARLFRTYFPKVPSSGWDEPKLLYAHLFDVFPQKPSFPTGAHIEDFPAKIFINSSWKELLKVMQKLGRLTEIPHVYIDEMYNNIEKLEKFDFNIRIIKMAIMHLIESRQRWIETSIADAKKSMPYLQESEELMEKLSFTTERLHDLIAEEDSLTIEKKNIEDRLNEIADGNEADAQRHRDLNTWKMELNHLLSFTNPSKSKFKMVK